jgi:hypothetical protein
MSQDHPIEPFCLILADDDRGHFSVEGPMMDDKAWVAAMRRAREGGRHVRCGPTSPDREALAAEFQKANKLRGVSPGSIVRLNR